MSHLLLETGGHLVLESGDGFLLLEPDDAPQDWMGQTAVSGTGKDAMIPSGTIATASS